MSWWIVLAAIAASFLLKLLGLVTPTRLLELPIVSRLASTVPVALLGALVASETFSTDGSIVFDSRAIGLLVAALALLVRAPFIVVVIVAAAATALVRFTTGLP